MMKILIGRLILITVNIFSFKILYDEGGFHAVVIVGLAIMIANQFLPTKPE